MSHDESKLPQWAQQTLYGLRREIDSLHSELRTTKEAHAVLLEREWFTIQGPGKWSDRDTYHLWFLDRDLPMAACALHKDDVLMVGRNKKGE